MTNFKKGDTVKYSNPINQDESNATFIVLEVSPKNKDTAEKLTVMFISKDKLNPINTFFSSEFVAL